MARRQPIIVVQGGQWGSEAKGAVAANLCIERKVDFAVRTGAINAGHTVVFNGDRYAMQQIPVGWVNPNTNLIIGPGAYIHPETLFREIAAIDKAMPGLDVTGRLYIDHRCGLHDEVAEGRSKQANRHHSIGATGKGCSEAIVSKIRDRNNGYKLFAESEHGRRYKELGGKFADTVGVLNNGYDNGAVILVEGTQGTALDLHLGPYPFTTSRMTSAANWIAEAGLSPSLDYEVVLVCRTYPIRVAGNSGPMPNEIEWTDLAERVNGNLARYSMPLLVSQVALQEFKNSMENAAFEGMKSGKYTIPFNSGRTPNLRLSTWTAQDRSIHRVAASELHRDALALCGPGTVAQLRRLFEMTTVTKKLRRIAAMDVSMLKSAIEINRPAWIALTFLDYWHPMLADMSGVTLAQVLPESPYARAMKAAAADVEKLAYVLGTPIKMVTVGPRHENMFQTDYLNCRISER